MPTKKQLFLMAFLLLTSSQALLPMKIRPGYGSVLPQTPFASHQAASQHEVVAPSMHALLADFAAALSRWEEVSRWIKEKAESLESSTRSYRTEYIRRRSQRGQHDPFTAWAEQDATIWQEGNAQELSHYKQRQQEVILETIAELLSTLAALQNHNLRSYIATQAPDFARQSDFQRSGFELLFRGLNDHLEREQRAIEENRRDNRASSYCPPVCVHCPPAPSWHKLSKILIALHYVEEKRHDQLQLAGWQQAEEAFANGRHLNPAAQMPTPALYRVPEPTWRDYAAKVGRVGLIASCELGKLLWAATRWGARTGLTLAARGLLFGIEQIQACRRSRQKPQKFAFASALPAARATSSSESDSDFGGVSSRQG